MELDGEVVSAHSAEPERKHSGAPSTERPPESDTPPSQRSSYTARTTTTKQSSPPRGSMRNPTHITLSPGTAFKVGFFGAFGVIAAAAIVGVIVLVGVWLLALMIAAIIA